MGMQPLSLMGVGMAQRSPRGEWPGGAGTRMGCPVRGELLQGLCEVLHHVIPLSLPTSLPTSGWWFPALLLVPLPALAGRTKRRLPGLPPTPGLGTPMAEGSAQPLERWC